MERNRELSIGLVSILHGIEPERMEAIIESAETRLRERKKLLSEDDVLSAVAYAVNRNMNLLSGLALGSKICKDVMDRLFREEEEAEEK